MIMLNLFITSCVVWCDTLTWLSYSASLGIYVCTRPIIFTFYQTYFLDLNTLLLFLQLALMMCLSNMC